MSFCRGLVPAHKSPRPRHSGRAIHILVAAGAALWVTVEPAPADIQTFAGIAPGAHDGPLDRGR